jgi:mannose-1-phosphate guanylyltransferase/phosphomannomutase
MMRKAIVMAGGQGLRLWPLTLSRPKPLIRVANRPVMAYILEWLREYGVTEVLVTLHYRADEICQEFGDGRALCLNLSYQFEEEPLGTAGAVERAGDWVAGEPFFIVSGDVLTDVNLERLEHRHRETAAWITLGLTRVANPADYGIVGLDAQGRVVRFVEKPRLEQVFSDLVNTGIYCADPRVLQRVPRGRPSDWSHDVFPMLFARGQPLFGQELEGYWRDVGSIDEYRRSQWDALKGSVDLALPGVAVSEGVRLGPNSTVAPGAVIQGPVLVGADCHIEQDAWLLPGTVIGDHSRVCSGACIDSATLGKGCWIGRGAMLQDCVLDDEVCVEAASSVSEGAIIGQGCRLVNEAHVGDGRRVGRCKWISGYFQEDPGEARSGAWLDLAVAS